MTPAVEPQNNLDLSACDREPIHIPGSIQPHGVLLCIDSQWRVIQASGNASLHFNIPPDEVIGFDLQRLWVPEQFPAVAARLHEMQVGDDPLYLDTLSIGAGHYHALAHRQDLFTVLEFEPAESSRPIAFQDLYSFVRRSTSRLKRASDLFALAHETADEVRAITGFDRVLVYRFDSDWNGHVIGEAKVPDWGSYLDLWFPASDIPQQARKLYELNRVRLIVDASYSAAPVMPVDNPLTEKPLDMSFSSLRSVSPVHLEYLRNMGVASSMSISILKDDGSLWGLIACHHRTPRFLPFEVRTACDILGQAVSSQIAAHEERADYERRIRLKSITTTLLQFMAQEDEFLEGLHKHPDELLAFARAGGAALLYGGRCTRVGVCPPEHEILLVVDWLVERGREEVYSTNCLPALIPESAACAESASGVMAISISKIHRSYILWFRPEVIQTIKWGGDPRKPAEPSADPARLHPRKSFETWKEIVSGRSEPWHRAEVDAALDLRNAVIGIVLRKAEEVAEVNEELQRSNRELEAFSYSVSHDLRAPFRHIVGYSELLKQSSSAKLDARDLRFLDVVIDSAKFAGTLVDNLLSFSQVGRARLKIQRVDSNVVVRDVRRDLDQETAGRRIEWKVGPLPEVDADLVMIRLVWQNLIQNALKYTRTREQAVIEITASLEDDEHIFRICDNGVGFEQQYAGKLFGVFQRLHRMEEYEGTGIGLANVRRIVTRHGGRTWAEGEVNKGACFYFSLPVAAPAS